MDGDFFEHILTAAVPAAAAFFIACAGTRALLPVLVKRAILDKPNERSSHDAPTPRGGGIAVVGAVVLTWIFTGGPAVWLPMAGALLLAAVSWMDDLKSLPPLTRLIVQFAAVGAMLFAGAEKAPVFQGLLPPYLDLIATGLLWIWFINLFNFMDGIDGISGVEAAGIGIGVAVIAGLPPVQGLPPVLGYTAAAAAIGFLCWNWHPARIFMGDVGSVPMGFLLGWLLLELARAGIWAPALILPLYYLTDATITLARRGLRGEKVWRAHKEHFYQRAVQAGKSHSAVSTAVLAANAGLVGLAVVSLTWPLAAVAGAAFIVVILLMWMRR